MLKYNKNTLYRIEQLFKEQKFTVIYERGNFNSGYCLVEDKKVVVINKYFSLKARINTLLEILPQVDVNQKLFTDASKRYIDKFADLPATQFYFQTLI